ncbi:rod shape-determining protein MreC [Cytobacillus firmus]|jgi:rod shape-determining protein MreC|uniref:Cell shape-determining protein MreC n=1 Tax=Cytobacillus firmus DS1 TaxID=1307436 RepID=W7KR33_CYTFI|nr:rod shape-determining protein MreC [Cytobacillus firmus]EWG09920.1 rod shape-determining protein MreC [Cytobacillus firmus DS1]MBG9543552.1 rod shape-determining protein MreC [Cytobacillus firmus]MBG9549413.1 rod shape-determining protein MreC [Cytobacillus firmus]MBG9554828.1 rod shape-determining protein MreC [Cytobacillus firmus]MBG9559599.1 rod shape-determining protein MreC [Cytobacillus firmus]
MPQFFLNKRLIILLVSIIILVALIGFSLKDRENLTWPEQFLKDTTGFIQNAVSSPVNYVAGFFENVEDLQNTYKENKDLKTRLDELARLESEVQRLKKDNTELREILDKKDSLSEFEPKQATVIGRNPDRWHELLIINKGKNAGIEPNMAVITSKGLIGKVKSSNTFTSTVQLLSSMDPTNRISAKIQAGENNFFGLIEGYDKEEGLLLLKRIPYDAKVEKDQNVITSGLGGVFPESLPIGKVVDVVPDEFGLTQTAYVKPGADFYDIGHVMVVKRGALQPELMEMVDEKEEEL